MVESRPRTGLLSSSLPQLPQLSGSRPQTQSQTQSQSRPTSKGLGALAVTGTAPPSRHGTAPGTAAPGTGRARTSGLSRSMDGPLSAAVQKLILKMRVRFGEAAADIKGQEIISAEVTEYVSQNGPGMKTEVLMELEKKIRTRLTGGTPSKMTLVLEKKARAEADEWSRMFQYNIQIGLAQDQAKAEAARQRQAEVKQELDRMIKGHEERRRMEAEEEQQYFRTEQAGLREWEGQEEAKRQLQVSIMAKLKLEREEQLREKRERKQKAVEQVRADEADQAARITHHTRTELEKEERERMEAKTQLVTFLSGNELNKQIREEEKRKQAAEDAVYKQLWEAKLDKQEADRTALLEKTKVRQKMQADAAAGREECKRWLDQDVIDRQYKEREERRAKEEEERQAKVKSGAIAAVRTLEVQVKEREQARLQDKLRDQDAAKMVLEHVAVEQAREDARRAAAADAKLRFKADLEAQMKANAHRRRVAPMTDMERKINSQMLDNVHNWQLSGKLTLT